VVIHLIAQIESLKEDDFNHSNIINIIKYLI
jgi:hypothetical protein